MDSVCLPCLCKFSPSSRKALTLEMSAAGNFAEGILASIARISPGQPCAEAAAANTMITEPKTSCFMKSLQTSMSQDIAARQSASKGLAHCPQRALGNWSLETNGNPVFNKEQHGRAHIFRIFFKPFTRGYFRHHPASFAATKSSNRAVVCVTRFAPTRWRSARAVGGRRLTAGRSGPVSCAAICRPPCPPSGWATGALPGPAAGQRRP